MQNWQIHPDYANGETGEAFRSLETVFRLQGEQITKGKLGATSRITVGGRTFYIKLYRQAGKGVRRWIGRSRLCGEWENLQLFERLKIPAPRLVAYGLEKKAGVFIRGAIITAGLPETDDLAELIRAGDPRLINREWVSAVSRQLAGTVRILHKHRFAHNDLHARNVLITTGVRPGIYLIDCPSGRFWLWPFLQHRKNKDLACLDKTARTFLSRTRRLRFVLEYLEKPRLNRRDKNQIRKVLNFFRKR